MKKSRRLSEYNTDLRAYKEHVDKLALWIYCSDRFPGNDVKSSVAKARQIIDEVDKQVDEELEQTKYEIDHGR